MHRPAWFRDGYVVVSSARTCGINKDGHTQYTVDRLTGRRTADVDDALLEDVRALLDGGTTPTLRAVPLGDVRVAVPTYFDRRYHDAFVAAAAANYPDFGIATIGQLIADGRLVVRRGHGSPSLDQRTGHIPYIKVSDLRAGMVNINPTNLVPESLARTFWREPSSGLRAYDLISPERASKNIGDFCVLMPGQEQVVLTKEVLVFRPGSDAPFDAFYLMWLMSLTIVRQQWHRVIFMQTNREDVGRRFEEIEVLVPPSAGRAADVSRPFREYYEGLAALRARLLSYLGRDGRHHFFVGASTGGHS
jgi:hypothetical protein